MHLTFLTDHRCAPIAQLCPSIDEVIALDRVAMRDGPLLSALKEMKNLVSDIRSRRFEVVVDFHSFRETNLLAWLSGAPSRLALRRQEESYLPFCFNLPPVNEDKGLHVADMFMKVTSRLGAIPTGSRTIVIPESIQQWASAITPSRQRIALYIDAPIVERIWPPERFAEIADFAIDSFGVEVFLLASPAGSSLIRRCLDASRRCESIREFSDLSLVHLSALIASSRLLISNDTGPMHIGPAVGVTTLGLFSVGFPEHFRPMGSKSRFLRGNPIENIQTSDVKEAVRQMWAMTAGLDLQY